MDYNDTPEVAEFRAQLRAWLGAHPNLLAPADLSDGNGVERRASGSRWR